MNKKVIKTAIILSWCFLIACLIMKCCGSEVFNAAIENKRILEICAWLETDGVWLQTIIMLFLYVFSCTVIIVASSLNVSIKANKKWLFIVIPTVCVAWIIKYFVPIAGLVAEVIMFIVLPACMSKKWWTGFLCVILNVLFQVISLFVRGADLSKFIDTNAVMSIVIGIDYYIMIALYYFYVALINKKKEEKANG